MKRLQILFYLLHVDKWQFILYCMPVMSIFCLAMAHVKMFTYARKIKRTYETRKVFFILRYFVTFNIIMLFAISLRYFDLHEPPQKDLIYHQKKTAKYSEDKFL